MTGFLVQRLQDLQLPPGDLIAGITTFHDHVLVVTQQGRIYKLSYTGSL